MCERSMDRWCIDTLANLEKVIMKWWRVQIVLEDRSILASRRFNLTFFPLGEKEQAIIYHLYTVHWRDTVFFFFLYLRWISFLFFLFFFFETRSIDQIHQDRRDASCVRRKSRKRELRKNVGSLSNEVLFRRVSFIFSRNHPQRVAVHTCHGGEREGDATRNGVTTVLKTSFIQV